MSEDVGLREQNPIVPALSGPAHFITAIRENWYLTVNLVRRDLRAKYRRAVIGYGWTWLEPLLLAAVYFILFTIVAGAPDPLYPLHVLLGVIIWGHFGKSLRATLGCLQKSKNLIKQVYFPREILATTPVLTQLWITTVSFIAVLPIMLYLDVGFSQMIWMLPAGLFLATSLAMGVGLILAPLNVISEDVGHLFRFIVRAGFFISPVMWTYEMALERDPNGQYLDLMMLNPMVVPLTMVRHGIDGTPMNIAGHHMAYSILVCISALLLGMAAFKKCESKVVKGL